MSDSAQATPASLLKRYPDLHIERQHTLGLEKARQITDNWILSAETDYRMQCQLHRSDTQDIVTFNRTGVSGQMISSPSDFQLYAKLGFLFKNFKTKISEQIEHNLDEVIKEHS